MPFTIVMSGDDDARKDIVYKGKSAKFWPHLPPEIIRLIATYHLLNLAAEGFCPGTWQVSTQWPGRLVYGLLRDVLEIEKLMSLYPTWYAALCRINSPSTSNGLVSAKWMVATPFLGTILVCKDHRRATYCGICLKETSQMDGEIEYAAGFAMGCVENEDDQMWPGIDTTCRTCRSEGLWRRAQLSPIDAEAVGGPSLVSDDWETRQAIETFVDLGEGTISDVLAVARDKYWYKKNTKLNDMLSQALAASRYVSRTEAGQAGYLSEDELSDEEEDDAELMSITEDAAGIREIAVSDYIRSRILDGHWVNPADLFYEHENCTVVLPAEHPCPWQPGAVFEGALDEGENAEDGEPIGHPRPKTTQPIPPPSELLSSMACQAFMKHMKDILMPAMRNIVERIEAECYADGKDPAVVAASMSLDDVVAALRDEAYWFTGVDWLERRANMREHERQREKDEDDSSSSRSGGSHLTSPVLSTTTLGTTPSPPPSGSSSGKDDESLSSPTAASAPAISVPVPRSPTLIHPIPYVPVKVSPLPLYSLDAFRYIWRNASAHLYECYCSICQRRILKAHAAAAQRAAAQQAQDFAPIAQDVPAVQLAVNIKIPEVPTEMLRAEEEEEEEEGESELDDVSVAETPAPPVTPRKRPSRELDADTPSDAILTRDQRSGTPPKRLRQTGSYSPTPMAISPSPQRLRKRSSEELDDDGRSPIGGNGESKRMRPDAPPTTPSPDPQTQNAKSVTETDAGH
ncbi:hypothetical protein IEO21_08196 [Rhodonia placenta]|uniref:Uncharacterized protein n=1 Tax=Rhodonia placenta TaxID=104341 RepID=A0A8H7TYY5_9APHY|nr:hypothetical protein IEO21_08196 [Postia placenta]